MPLNKYTRKRSSNHSKHKPHTYKQMQCSPMVKSKQIPGTKTCYTPGLLNQIKTAYNEEHPDNKIISNNPSEIWTQLRERLSHKCDSEDCWLNYIKDENLRKKIDTHTFAPDHPKEWHKDPNTWLSNFDIMDVLNQYEHAYPEFEFINPSPIDYDAKNTLNGDKCVTRELCTFSLNEYLSNKTTKIGVVFNLSTHDIDGTHWVSLFIDLRNKFMFYFDSNGSPMPAEVKKLISTIKKQGKSHGMQFRVLTNVGHRHQEHNTECGMYSLFFIVTMLTGKPTGNEKNSLSLEKRFELFLKNKLPDKQMETFRKIYFNE